MRPGSDMASIIEQALKQKKLEDQALDMEQHFEAVKAEAQPFTEGSVVPSVDKLREFVQEKLESGILATTISAAFGLPAGWMPPSLGRCGLPEDRQAAEQRWILMKTIYSQAGRDEQKEAAFGGERLPDTVHEWLTLEDLTTRMLAATKAKREEEALDLLDAGLRFLYPAAAVAAATPLFSHTILTAPPAGAAWDACDQRGRSCGSIALSDGLGELAQAYRAIKQICAPYWQHRSGAYLEGGPWWWFGWRWDVCLGLSGIGPRLLLLVVIEIALPPHCVHQDI